MTVYFGIGSMSFVTRKTSKNRQGISTDIPPEA
jgi:hypothetical protein